MNRTIGIRRTIVQHVDGRPLARLANALVNPHLFPTGQYLGLVLRQVGLHRECGFRQIDSGFQIERHSLVFSQMIDFPHYREREEQRPLGHAKRRKYRPQRHCESTIASVKKRVQFSSKGTFCASNPPEGRRSTGLVTRLRGRHNEGVAWSCNPASNLARNVLII